jgi:methionyl-tRNA formyltransferase
MAWIDMIKSKETTAPKAAPAPTPATAPAPTAKENGSSTKIRVVFMGTPEFAAVMLDGLIDDGYNVVGVVTKPDKPAGREQESTASRVKEVALEHNLPVEQPERIDEEAIKKIDAWKPDLIVVAAYGKILPQAVLDIPGFGCINVHASLLPKWRGASPIQNALLAGETETGVTIMLMDKGMDTGDIIVQEKVEIDPDETKERLLIRLTGLGRDTLIKTIPAWVRRKITAVPQDGSQATLCQLIERNDGHIVWTDDAKDIYDRYRALFPWPGIFAFWKKDDGLLRLKLHKVSYQKQSPQAGYPIGQVIEVGEKVGVQAGSGVVFLEEVQLEGKTRMDIAEFIRGNQDFIGTLLQ